MATRLLRAQGEEPRQVATAVNQALLGKLMNTGSVSLTASATTTAVSDRLCGPDSVIVFMPTTANAAGEIGGGLMYVSARVEGQFTITHANAGSTDRTFAYCIFGG